MAEQWRDVSGYDGIYQVSDRGQVRNTHTSKILQPIRIKNGRLYVTLSSDGFQRKCTVHSLVAAAFLGDCPPKHETTHKDGDYTNNGAGNLEYVTRGENQKRFVMRSGGYSVNLTKRVQTANGMRYCPVAQSANGRSSRMSCWSMERKSDTRKARTTSNGAKEKSGSGYQWVRILPTPAPDASARKPS